MAALAEAISGDVEAQERETVAHIREKVREQLDLWRLIPQMIELAERSGIRMDQQTRFRRRWRSAETDDEWFDARHTDSSSEYTEHFWYVGELGQGRLGSLGVSCETGEFVMVGEDGLRTEFPEHFIIEAARNRSETLDAAEALQDVTRAISRQAEASRPS